MTPRPSGHADVPAHVRLGPPSAVSPLVVAVPHAGRHYPPAIDATRAVGWVTLAQLEDRYADRLIGPLLDLGAVAIVATVARAWIDLNRGEGEVAAAEDGGGPRTRAGLGLVPSQLAGRRLWRQEPEMADVQRRIATVHRPYHAAIAGALAQAVTAHGHALLLDCHSMPSLGGSARPPRYVVGDRHGTSAARPVSRAALVAAGGGGHLAVLNTPYAGAYTLQRHGRPGRGVHALQLEVDRLLYLDRAGEPAASGVASVGEQLAAIAEAALDAARPQAVAAE